MRLRSMDPHISLSINISSHLDNHYYLNMDHWGLIHRLRIYNIHTRATSTYLSIFLIDKSANQRCIRNLKSKLNSHQCIAHLCMSGLVRKSSRCISIFRQLRPHSRACKADTKMWSSSIGRLCSKRSMPGHRWQDSSLGTFWRTGFSRIWCSPVLCWFGGQGTQGLRWWPRRQKEGEQGFWETFL